MDAVCTGPAPWTAFYRRWRFSAPPLRPHADVCEQVRKHLASHADRVLLLGVTPELADVGVQTFAIDTSESATTIIWPGNTVARRAMLGDWRQLPCANGSVSAAIGDGSLNCVEYPSGYRRIFAELSRVVRSGGRIVIRAYLTPSPCESIAAVRDAALAGRVGNIHALKLRLAMAIGAQQESPNVAVQEILRVFNREFPDRSALRRATGWRTEDIVAQLDAYNDLPEVYSFPTREHLLTCVPGELKTPRLASSGMYELAERCPLLVMDVRS
jgi:SAM-dependent methyltransferase